MGLGRVIMLYGSKVLETFPKEVLCFKSLPLYVLLSFTEVYTKFAKGKGIIVTIIKNKSKRVLEN